MLRRKVLASAVALGAAAVIMVFSAANAVADSCDSNARNTNAGNTNAGNTNAGKPNPGKSIPDNSTRGNSAPGMSAGRSSCDGPRDHRGNSSTDVSKDVDQTQKAPSPPPLPSAVSTTPSSGTATDGPTVGGGPATTGAAGTETETVSTAPTPPNGAEPAAAGSPAPADIPSQATPDQSPVASPPAAQGGAASGLPDLSGVPSLFGDALGVTGPHPVAAGLSPDTTKSGVLVAVLALAVLLFLAAYQLVDRRDRGLAGARDAESVANFK